MRDVAPQDMDVKSRTRFQKETIPAQERHWLLQIIANSPNQAVLIASALSNPAAGLMFAGVTTASSAIQENQQAGVDPVTGIPNALAKRCNRICIRKTWHNWIYREKCRTRLLSNTGKTPLSMWSLTHLKLFWLQEPMNSQRNL